MRRRLLDPSEFSSYTFETASPAVTPADSMPRLLAVPIVLWLAAMCVFAQEQALGLSFIEQTQVLRHDAVLAGTAPDPWAYRLLSEWVVAGVLRIAHAVQFARPAVVGYLTLRLLQNVAIFLLAIAYYRRLGLGPQLQAVGVVLLAWSMSQALYNSDLSVNTYFDLIAYLIAAVSVASGRTWALVPIVVVAALNRDTSAMIPLLAVAPLVARAVDAPRQTVDLMRPPGARRTIVIAAIGVVAFGAVYLGIRAVVGPASWPWGNTGAATMLRANLHDRNAYLHVPLTFSVLPLLAVWRWRQLPELLRGLLVLFGPVWVTTLFLIVYVAETRIFLVPIALAFIPAVLVSRPVEGRVFTVGLTGRRYEAARPPTTSSELPNGTGTAPSSRSSSRDMA
jgi:hypothetical protein